VELEIEAYEPTVSVAVLVAELNQLYHRHEASGYERTHPEIFCQLPKLWREMIQIGKRLCPDKKVNVLDFGCGTGFAARQWLANLGEKEVGHLVCYDPCPEMLDQCRTTLRSFSRAIYVTERSAIGQLGITFDLLLTNSVLHHITNPVSEIRSLAGILGVNAIWLCGHEPSVRFLQNPKCLALFDAYCHQRQWRRYLSPYSYWQRLASVRGPSRRAARLAFQQGLFRHLPPSQLIAQLVDYHVLSRQCCDRERGLDIAVLEAAFKGEWVLEWLRTYSYMGPYYEPNLPRYWRRRARQLAVQFPLDGANTCSVWQRPR